MVVNREPAFAFRDHGPGFEVVRIQGDAILDARDLIQPIAQGPNGLIEFDGEA